MLRKLIAFSVVFGMFLANSIAAKIVDSEDRSILTNALLDLSNETGLESRTVPEISNTGSEDPLKHLLPKKVQLTINLLNSIIGVKLSALTLAVNVIEWTVSNAYVIIAGVLATLGFCKFTGKCVLFDKELVPIAELRSLASPENLNAAQSILMTAVKKYAEEK